MPAHVLRLEHLPADVLGLTTIARAALAEGPHFSPLPLARSPREIPLPAERHTSLERQELGRALRAGLAPIATPSRVEASLRALEREGTFAVVTGQQPGLLASPLYTLYKALQACKLAHALSLQWGRPVVPLFWNHGDDHDVAEVHHAYLVNRNLDLQKVALASLSSGRVPIGRILLEEERHRLGAIRSALAQMVEEHQYVVEALELFMPRAGESLARALTRALCALCGEHGLVVIEPEWVRGALSHALVRTIALDPRDALESSARALALSGFEVPIAPGAAALVFHVDDEGRRPLRAGGDGFRYDNESGSRTAAELAAEIQDSPERWSAGALLRPIVQDLALPSAAYIGGFGELAYHAELGELRARLTLPRSPFVARISCTLVDPEARAALEKLGLDVRAVLERRGALTPAGTELELPVVITRLRSSAQVAVAMLLEEKGALSELDPSFGPNLQRAAGQVSALIEKLLERAERVHKNRSGKGARHLRRITNALYPRDEPQERVLGPFAFTARFGRAWIDALYDELPPIASEHLVVQLAADNQLDQREP